MDGEVFPTEEQLECLCKLLDTVGADLDAGEKGKKLMSKYFKKLKKLLVSLLPHGAAH